MNAIEHRENNMNAVDDNVELSYSVTTPSLQSTNPMMRIKAVSQLSNDFSEKATEKLFEALYDGDQRVVLAALQAMNKRDIEPAISLVNALFLSSSSQSLDKVCLDIIAKIGDQQSRRLLYKRFPRPEGMSMTLLPHYINALGAIGEEDEVELLSRIVNNFWGLYRNELLNALERIISRLDHVIVSIDVINAFQKLFDDAEPRDRKRIIELIPHISNELMLSVLLCGLENEHPSVRKASVTVLGCIGSEFAHRELERHFREEDHEEVLEEYARWLLFAEDEYAAQM